MKSRWQIVSDTRFRSYKTSSSLVSRFSFSLNGTDCTDKNIQGGPAKVRPTYIFDGSIINIRMHS